MTGHGQDYSSRGLSEADVDPGPFVQFRRWMDDALAAELPLPNAMTLATAGSDGRPAARMVLLRGFDERGFVFYTNYDGDKAAQLGVNPWTALVFYWGPLERQVRVVGAVSRVSEAESDTYFAGRPRESQIGAWASPQSDPIRDRAELEERVRAVEARYPPGEPIPRPPHWGGYRVTPDELEFWQGRPGRLHDRIRYRLTSSGLWTIERLAP